ncbi:peptidase M28 [Thioalkalivibrio nitratireducens DSM 14787]|uniref:Peptidase M28 n=1 Tax=Thioalkalivibrio nitratireducens (strain DSM 14787 / UNIQEM 213 / ALEN2) TaxID=1255043 RepID=L0E224_THIND|nr:M20/M25/M40 family metallo-hydrolase [Thioalkalivibrio nitratireducens]AGA34701.1 peptidase M28 [Thioalkalivibrio nitratireducens DSM 14787]
MMFQMPGESYQGTPPPLKADGQMLRERLQEHVRMLADEIGERHYWQPERLHAAADYIARTFREAGHKPIRHRVPAWDQEFHNIEVQLPHDGVANEILVIGAHYDTVRGTPGADDNASGVAVLLELARLLRDTELGRSVRLVAFANEEAPFFGSAAMGSLHYARQARERGDDIVGMISLEMVGYYSDEPDSQSYPPLLGHFYPDRGNFIAFVSNLRSRGLVRQTIQAFREHADVPSEGLAAPELIPDILRSDHWAFQQMGYPAIMLTDTANFRNPAYHGPHDTPDRLDYETMARLTAALAHAVETMSQR